MKTSTATFSRSDRFMNKLVKRNPGQPEFHQAVREFADVVIPFIEVNPKYHGYGLIERMTEPDRTYCFSCDLGR